MFPEVKGGKMGWAGETVELPEVAFPEVVFPAVTLPVEIVWFGIEVVELIICVTFPADVLFKIFVRLEAT